MQFDSSKNAELLRKHGVSLAEAWDIFDQTYIVDAKNDDPEQFRAIGWSRGSICSVSSEVRHHTAGDFYHLVTTQALKLGIRVGYEPKVHPRS
ncbi:MAG: BrnT family toxin [Bryobacterales bacterium]|nr:BrnT family toxin [Bryobacterales bacterium]